MPKEIDPQFVIPIIQSMIKRYRLIVMFIKWNILSDSFKQNK